MNKLFVMKTVKNHGLTRSIVSLIIGLLMVIFPGFVAGSLVQIVGCLLILIGVASIVLFMKGHSMLMLLLSIVELSSGMVLLVWPGYILDFIFMILGLMLLIFAVEEIIAFARVKADWKAFILPVLILVCGVVIFFLPSGAVNATVILFGSALIVYAFSSFIAGRDEEKFEKYIEIK